MTDDNVSIQHSLIDSGGGPPVVSDVIDVLYGGNIVRDCHTITTGCSSPGQCTAPLDVAGGGHIASLG